MIVPPTQPFEVFALALISGFLIIAIGQNTISQITLIFIFFTLSIMSRLIKKKKSYLMYFFASQAALSAVGPVMKISDPLAAFVSVVAICLLMYAAIWATPEKGSKDG